MAAVAQKRWGLTELHPSLSGSPVTRVRARVVQAVAVAAIVSSSAAEAIRSLAGDQTAVAMLVWAASTAFICMGLWALRRLGSLFLAGGLSLIGVAIGVIVVAAMEGGLSHPNMAAVPGVPLFGVFVGGRRLGLWLAAGVVLMLACLAVPAMLGHVYPPIPLTYQELPALQFSILILVTAILLVLGLVHEREISRERATLEEQATALVTARDAALAATQAKTTFLANMSHELRTPMNAILGAVELLADNPDPQARQRLLRMMSVSGSHLLSVVDAVLDLAKIESGKAEPSITALSLRSLVEGTCSMFSARADARGLQLVVELSDMPGLLWGDETRLRQILLNLIGNAFKFTTRGEVRVTVARDREQCDTYHFSVQDTGEGIPADRLSSIFERFTQADNSMTRRHGGTGLGLTISQSLVRQMGGELRVQSTVKQGSKFYFSLVLPTAPAHEAKPSLDLDPTLTTPSAQMPGPQASSPCLPAAPATGLRILVAEDVPLNREIVQGLLQGHGFELSFAEDGAGAVELAQHTRLDLILMDVQMPGMDGYEATRRIRERERELQLPRVPIIAMTAHAIAGAAEQSLAVGCDGHITKPVTRATLLGTVERYTRAPTAAAG